MDAQILSEASPVIEANGLRVFAITCLIGGLTVFCFLTAVFGLNLNTVSAECADVGTGKTEIAQQVCSQPTPEFHATSPAAAASELKVRTGSNCLACDAT